MNEILDVFQQWFQVHRAPLEVEGIAFEFSGETQEQTVKTNNLNLIYGQYEGGICLWEHGSCNITLADMGAAASEPMEECISFVELQLETPHELDFAMSAFFQMLIRLPQEHISARVALGRYWQSLPAFIHHEYEQ